MDYLTFSGNMLTERGESNMGKKLLKDNIANIILTDESCRDYLVSIVSAAIKMDKE